MPRSNATAIQAAILVVVAAGCSTMRPQAIQSDLEQTNVKRIVFLGDSITYDGRYVADFECWLRRRYPDRPFEIINVGLPSETVSGLTEDGHADGKFDRPCLRERLPRVLEKTKPDLVVACYGINCGIYKPFDRDRFARYRDGIMELHEVVAKSRAHIVHVTPPMYDAMHAGDHVTEYNDVLGRYSNWLLSKREKGWEVIDLHGPMTAEVDRIRGGDPYFTFAPDGVHPDDAGHWFMAQQLIAYFGDAEAASADSVEAMLGDKAAALPRVSERMALWRNAWLTATGHSHPMIPAGVSIEEAEKAAEELTHEIDDALCDC